MAELLTFGEAAQRAGVSRQRLNRAIHAGRLPAERGGGPGKPTRIKWEDLQAWCASERLPMPVNIQERAAGTSHGPYHGAVALTAQADMAALMERVERTVEQVIGRAIERVVDQVVERLAERLTGQLSGRLERTERSRRSASAMPDQKAAVLTRLRAMQAEGLSLQAIANRLNTEGVPTLSGKEHWQKGTIGNLLAQAEG
jgi:excisionase family DNA binding protein